GAVVDRVVAVDEVPAVDVVDVAVAIVVDAVDRVVGVGPGVGTEVWVGELNPLVDDADVDRLRAGVAGRPRLLGLAAVDVRRAGRSDRGRRVVAVHAPQRAVGVVRVVGDVGGGEDPVRLGVGDQRVVLEQGRGRRGVGGAAQHLQAGVARVAHGV